MIIEALNNLIEQLAPGICHADHLFTTNRNKLAGIITHKRYFMGFEIGLVTKKVDAGRRFYRCQDIVGQAVHN